MGKAQKSNKESKKKPGMTPQEKKALKKLKKNLKKQCMGLWDYDTPPFPDQANSCLAVYFVKLNKNQWGQTPLI